MNNPAMTDYEIANARRNYPKLNINWFGKAPEWSDLGCRGCGDIIYPGVDAVDCGVGAFHLVCYDLITAEETL